MEKYRLILVEDDDQIRNGLEHYFPWGEIGFSLEACLSNGLQGLKYVQEHDVDVILTDIRMPVMDGLEMLEKIRLENPSIYVVVLSAYRNFDYAQRAMELGVSNYVVKSTKYDDLMKVFKTIYGNLGKNDHGQYAAVRIEESPMTEDIIGTLKKYIRSHIDSVTLQAAADYVGYNSIYLSKLFKQKMGVNFIDYLIKEKMSCAAEMLKVPQYSIAAISERVGYSNETNFSRTFKRFYGVSPAEYRKLAR